MNWCSQQQDVMNRIGFDCVVSIVVTGGIMNTDIMAAIVAIVGK